MQQDAETRPDPGTLRYLSVLADADPRTVEKVLTGVQVRGICGRRIRAALEAAGIAVPQAEAQK